jgi:hypothetical protein
MRVVWEVHDLSILLNGGGHVNMPESETSITRILEM